MQIVTSTHELRRHRASSATTRLTRQQYLAIESFLRAVMTDVVAGRLGDRCHAIAQALTRFPCLSSLVEEGVAYPSWSTIGAAIGRSPRQVGRLIVQLEQRGHLRRTRRPGRMTRNLIPLLDGRPIFGHAIHDAGVTGLVTPMSDEFSSLREENYASLSSSEQDAEAAGREDLDEAGEEPEPPASTPPDRQHPAEPSRGAARNASFRRWFAELWLAAASGQPRGQEGYALAAALRLTPADRAAARAGLAHRGDRYVGTYLRTRGWEDAGAAAVELVYVHRERDREAWAAWVRRGHKDTLTDARGGWSFPSRWPQ
jgi:hypothetical protein